MSIGEGTLAVQDADDVPSRPVAHLTRADKTFHMAATAAASVCLIIVSATLIFMVQKSRPAFQHAGYFGFFTKSVWNPSVGKFGVAGLLYGTIIIAVISMVLAVPLGVAMALFINEYAPARIRRILTSTVDLLAALPSLLFGIWGLKALESHIKSVSYFIASHLSVVPFLRAQKSQALVGSSFLAGIVVAIMITPIITSVSRDVMAQVPREQCEGALALGGTRWGMIREVILPFARGGIVGAALLGFGRALGETIAVALLINPQVTVNTHVLTSGASSVAAHIAIHFGEANSLERSGLVAAGLALFLLTFAVNLGARAIVGRQK